MMHLWRSYRDRTGLGHITTVVLLACVALAIFWHLGSQQTIVKLDELRWVLASRERSQVENLTMAKERLALAQSAWDRALPRLGQARTSLEAETAMLERMALASRQADVTVSATQLLPIEQFGDLVQLGVELRGRGGQQAVVQLMQQLAHMNPSHLVTSVRLDNVSGGDNLTFAMTVRSFAIVSDDPHSAPRGTNDALLATPPMPMITLFGSRQEPLATPELTLSPLQAPPWRLVGVVLGEPQHVALLRPLSGGPDVFVHVGDSLGEVTITNITPTSVTVQQHDVRWQLDLAP